MTRPKRYDREFHQEVRHLLRVLDERFTRKELAAILHVNKCVLYHWASGSNTPIWLARQATISILRALADTTLRS